jgi:replicative DNA helicase
LDHGPPQCVEAERAMLALLLLDPSCIAEVAAALEPADFGDRAKPHHLRSDVVAALCRQAG